MFFALFPVEARFLVEFGTFSFSPHGSGPAGGALASGATGDARAEVAAAKVATGEAAYTAARTALQPHGALGRTDEYDLSLWIREARALRSARGSPSACRARVLAP
ncbi:hypothetical protein JK364_05500 [Streptomyces sp. 110]|uniref:Acyl-CoA dehydrogenase/oxidase C-terminal domain-containing protein n=1 Tax=Streptomyces endocoffeicus TaxID=2898945 RepID=A0ABS1PHY0_9ACTN|nr:hypothetical protein [Streptomyces endocoffeicus]